MTAADLRARLADVERREREIVSERYRVALAIEEAEGRSDSIAARFARAYLAEDVEQMRAVCSEDRRLESAPI